MLILNVVDKLSEEAQSVISCSITVAVHLDLDPLLLGHGALVFIFMSPATPLSFAKINLFQASIVRIVNSEIVSLFYLDHRCKSSSCKSRNLTEKNVCSKFFLRFLFDGGLIRTSIPVR
jgi:hypothetical protein